MKAFFYQAAFPDGSVRSGQTKAETEAEARRKLQKDGLIVVSIADHPAKSNRFSLLPKRALGLKDKLYLAENLGDLLASGVAIDKALRMLMDVADNPRQQRTMEQVMTFLGQGYSLSEAFNKAEVKDDLFTGLIEAGEQSGALARILKQIGGYLSIVHELKEFIINAAIYPVLLTVSSIIALFFLFVFVLPSFKEVFTNAGVSPPAVTAFMIGLGEWLKGNIIWVLLLLTALLLALLHLARRPGWRRYLDKRLLTGKYLRQLFLRWEMIKFCRTLGILLNGGVSLMRAIAINKRISSNQHMKQHMDQVAEKLKKGNDLSQSMHDAQVFPPLVQSLVRLGEESGRLPAMLQRGADMYENQLKSRIKRFVALFEPMLIIAIGGVIGFIVFSILMSVLSINEIAF